MRKRIVVKDLDHQVEMLKLQVQSSAFDLEKQSSLVKAMLEFVQEALIVINLENNAISYNNYFLEMWDVKNEEVQGKSTTDLIQLISEKVTEQEDFVDVMKNVILNPRSGIIRQWQTLQNKILELYVHPQEMGAKVVGMLISFRDVTANIKLEQELMEQATHDALTGLPNRALLINLLNQAIGKANYSKSAIGVMLIAIDNFKTIYESLGYEVGDEVIKYIANYLRTYLNNSEVIAKIEGEQFIILFTRNINKNSLLENAKKIQQLFSNPYLYNGDELVMSASIGVSMYPADGTDVKTLLKNADAALHQAKKIANNTLQFYQSDLNANAGQRMALLSALRHALEKNQLLLHYQPLVELATGKILGFEALIRWMHPEHGITSPLDFIPLAEESGLIIPIGEWVLKLACQQAKKWQVKHDPSLTIAVNVSGVQFRQENFTTIVREAIKETAITPQNLVLEITESVILGDASDVVRKMLDLKDLNVQLSMDDFGIGYASLSYLKSFPFDNLKIDKSFINNIALNREDSSIVEGIIKMTEKMKLSVIAEGVETVEQVKFLLSHHAGQVQGYYFSPPLDSVQCDELLTKQKKLKDTGGSLWDNYF